MKNNLCKYKDIFGSPNQGVHKYRLFNIAIIDLVATIILALLIVVLAGIWSVKNLIIVSVLLILISIPIHMLFCVKTTLTNLVRL